MNKNIKIWLVVGLSLMTIGALTFFILMQSVNWDFNKLATVKYENNIYEIQEEIKSISMKTDTADIIFAISDESICKVVCYEIESEKHSVKNENGTLLINKEKTSWYENINIFNFDSPKLTVYLPKTEYDKLEIKGSTGYVEIPKDFTFESVDISVSTGDVKCYASSNNKIEIKSSTGKIYMENQSAGMVDLSVTTGEIIVKGLKCSDIFKVSVSTGDANIIESKCNNFISDGNTGDILLKEIEAVEKISIVRTTGDVEIKRCDGKEISITTDTGDITGSFLTEKVYITKTNTGKVNVPASVTGGKCEITTVTGDIDIK